MGAHEIFFEGAILFVPGSGVRGTKLRILNEDQDVSWIHGFWRKLFFS